jgi:hypothetical protein
MKEHGERETFRLRIWKLREMRREVERRNVPYAGQKRVDRNEVVERKILLKTKWLNIKGELVYKRVN